MCYNFIIIKADEEKGQENIDLYALSALLMDADNGRVLWEMNGYEERAMASTTKIMTTMIASENGNLDDVVTVSKNASNAPKVKLYIKEGEQYVLKDLLYALMLESSNDVAIAIAEHIGGSVEEFCLMMTQKAHDLGAYDTCFKTPNGLDANGHQTTAYDMALITKTAITDEQFIEITNTMSWTFSEVSNKRNFTVNNKNRFLSMMDGAIGVKTGFTSEAGYCFVGALESEDRTFITVVLASGWPPNKLYKFNDTVKLMNYAMDNFYYKEIVTGTEVYEDLTVIDGKEEKVSVEIDGQIGLLLKEDEKIEIITNLPDIIVAPIEKDTKIGSVVVYIDGAIYREVSIKTTEAVEKIDFKFCLDIILNKFFIKN